MADARVRSSADKVVVWLDHNSIAPMLPKMDPRPRGQRQSKQCGPKSRSRDLNAGRDETHSQETNPGFLPKEERKCARSNEQTHQTIKSVFARTSFPRRRDPIKA